MNYISCPECLNFEEGMKKALRQIAELETILLRINEHVFPGSSDSIDGLKRLVCERDQYYTEAKQQAERIADLQRMNAGWTEELVAVKHELRASTERVTDLSTELLKYQTAIDAIYNGGDIGRSLVLKHFGFLHTLLNQRARQEAQTPPVRRANDHGDITYHLGAPIESTGAVPKSTELGAPVGEADTQHGGGKRTAVKTTSTGLGSKAVQEGDENEGKPCPHGLRPGMSACLECDQEPTTQDLNVCEHGTNTLLSGICNKCVDDKSMGEDT